MLILPPKTTENTTTKKQKQEIFKTANDGNNTAAFVAPAMAANNTRIPNLQKFAGDNKISFLLLVIQFEAIVKCRWE